MKKRYSTDTPTEKRVGYSRAISVDDKRLYISGTTSVDERGTVLSS